MLASPQRAVLLGLPLALGAAVGVGLLVAAGAVGAMAGSLLAALCGAGAIWIGLKLAGGPGAPGRAPTGPTAAALRRDRAADLEAELGRTRSELERVQRLGRIGSWRWSVPRDELIEGSEEYARIHGAPRDTICELLKGHLTQLVHPEDRERVARAFRRADESGAEYSVEYRIVRPDGEVRHLIEVGEVLGAGEDGELEQVGTVQDITERKRAEEALRRAHDELESRVEARTAELREREAVLRTAARISRMGYAIWDEIAGRCVTVSEEFAQLFGCEVDEYVERFGTRETDLMDIHPEDAARYAEFDRAYRRNPYEAELEYRVAFPGHTVQHVREVQHPVFDARGRLVQTILAIQDITDLKQTEEQLRQAQKMEAVGQLTGGIAHDFNNLLAVILGNLELLEGRIDEKGEPQEWVQRAIAAAERGANLIQRMLAFSRKQALRPELVDANRLVAGMLDLLRRTLGETIQIEVTSAAGLWLSRVDPGQLENALLNLAINARDAMPDGGRLAIATANARVDPGQALDRPDLEPGEYVLLSIRDTGLGMPSEISERAFEPFFTTKDLGAGSGLGLSMVYGFVKQSGGHVQIQSEEGRGTEIRMYLPRHLGGPAEAHRRDARGELEEARSEIVLIVEDDADLRSVISRMLRVLGYGVRQAGSGSAALELLASDGSIDLLLTDVVLPGRMSGGELVEEAARRGFDLPVLFMSGYTGDAIGQRGRLHEEASFLQKPFRLAEVAAAIRHALHAQRR